MAHPWLEIQEIVLGEGEGYRRKGRDLFFFFFQRKTTQKACQNSGT